MTAIPGADTGQREGSDAPAESVKLNRATWRHEAALLIVLALVGAALEFGLSLSFKLLDSSQIGRTYPIFAIVIVLTSMVPFAIRINPRLGLPGAPLIAAKLAGEKLHFRIRSLLRISVGYAFLALAIGAAVVMIVFVPLILAHPKMQFPAQAMMKLPPGRIAIVGALAAIAAGISEEIQFRLVLFAIFAWIARLFTAGSSGPSSRGALWFATILQAYAFGMIHLGPLVTLIRMIGWSHTTIPILVSGLLLPQMWVGIVLGRLYLKRGLEAAMIAHATIDSTLFVLLAITRSLLRAR